MISPVRRTTIVVSDMQKSLNFYRDILGMNIFYDQEIQAEASAKLMGVPDCFVRLVSLQSDDSVNGMVGLLSFISPEIKPRKEVKQHLSTPDVMLLFMADDIDIAATHAKLKQSGIDIICAPLQYNVPERGPLSGFTCYDPDGVLVAVMRFGPLEQEGGKIKASPTRRTSIVVADMEKSLSFYRDTLGMRVFYDQVIDSPEEGQMLGVPGAKIRVVSLQSEDNVEGMVGLMAFIEPSVQSRHDFQAAVTDPDIFLIFMTDQMEAVYHRLQQQGANVKCAPVEYEIPGRGISAGMTCYDPDGVLVEFTQFGPLKQ